MYNNIGKKIKILAKVLAWIGIAAFVIAGIVMMGVDENLVLTGVLFIIIGPLLSWIASFFIYAFGELVENSDILANRFSDSDNSITHSEKAKPKDNPHAAQYTLSENDAKWYAFVNTVVNANSADLQIIVNDQKDLYSKREYQFIKEELARRNGGNKQ